MGLDEEDERARVRRALRVVEALRDALDELVREVRGVLAERVAERPHGRERAAPRGPVAVAGEEHEAEREVAAPRGVADGVAERRGRGRRGRGDERGERRRRGPDRRVVGQGRREGLERRVVEPRLRAVEPPPRRLDLTSTPWSYAARLSASDSVWNAVLTRWKAAVEPFLRSGWNLSDNDL